MLKVAVLGSLCTAQKRSGHPPTAEALYESKATPTCRCVHAPPLRVYTNGSGPSPRSSIALRSHKAALAEISSTSSPSGSLSSAKGS
eukprot:1493153-Alexandrium_andersonii.AAC.1